MKKDDIFDALGEIDDKFFEEAMEVMDTEKYRNRADISEENSEVVKVDEVTPAAGRSRFPIWAVLSAAAACAAVAFGIWANITGKNPLLPTNAVESEESGESLDTSESSGDSEKSGAEYIGILESDIEECNKILAESSPDTHIMSSRIMDINFDGRDEIVAITNSSYGLAVFSKTKDGIVITGHIGESAETDGIKDLALLNKFDKNGEQYWYYCYNYSGAPFSDTYILAAIWFNGIKYPDGENYYAQNLLSFGTIDYTNSAGADTSPVTKKFYRKGWDNNIFDGSSNIPREDDISREEFKALWEQYDAAPDFEEVDKYGGELIAEYHPDNTTNLYLIGKEKFGGDGYTSYYNALKAIIEIDGEKFSTGISSAVVGMRAPTSYAFSAGSPAQDYLKLYKLDGGYILSFTYQGPELFGYTDTSFYAIVELDGKLTMYDYHLYGMTPNEVNAMHFGSAEYTEAGISWGVMMSDNVNVNGNTISDNENFIFYTFDFDNIKKAMTDIQNYKFGYDFTATDDGSAFVDDDSVFADALPE